MSFGFKPPRVKSPNISNTPNVGPVPIPSLGSAGRGNSALMAHVPRVDRHEGTDRLSVLSAMGERTRVGGAASDWASDMGSTAVEGYSTALEGAAWVHERQSESQQRMLDNLT